MNGSSIQMPVGRYGVNKSTDVERVQRLLNRAIATNAKLKSLGIEPLDVDGRCGSRTIGAIDAYQSNILRWSGRSVDGTVHPDRATWKSLNGNVLATTAMRKIVTPAYLWQPAPSSIVTEPKKPPIAPAAPASGHQEFKQGNYQDSLGLGGKTSSGKTATIANVGCALCTLTMAATYIGSPNEKYWPRNLEPKDLTPDQANSILRKAPGAFSGYQLVMPNAARALGMKYVEHGRDKSLHAEDVSRIDAHLNGGAKLVAAHVDYKRSAGGDHWILISKRDGTSYTATDPTTGKAVLLSSKPPVENARYASTKSQRTGVLFGWSGSGGSRSQELYIVVRFGLLSPLV